ncbi:MAG: hypothetical protein ACREQO_17030 [Candidatus Binatia bacterium]
MAIATMPPGKPMVVFEAKSTRRNDRHRQHGDQRVSENLEREIHRNKSNRNARQSRQQRGARSHPAHALGDESRKHFNEAVEKTGDQPNLPSPNWVIGLLDDRQDDKRNVSKQAHGVDAIRKRGNIGSSRFTR